MNSEVLEALDEVILTIKRTKEYQECLQLFSLIAKNRELVDLIEEIKKLQKKYVQSHFQNQQVKEQLDSHQKTLEQIPLYVSYNQRLDFCNQMIETVKDEMNEYFFQKLNILQ